jgi:two-component system OmpR family sensor kinase
MNLRTRLLAAAVLLVSCLAVSGYLIIRTVENAELHQLDSQLNNSIPIAAGVARNRPPPSGYPPQVAQPDRLSDTYLAVVAGGQRTTIAAPQGANGREPQTPSTISSSIASAKPTTVPSVNGSGRWRAIVLQTPDGNQLLLAVFMGPIDSTTTELKTAVFVAAGVTAIILLAVGIWIEQLGLRPIARMKRTAEAILAGDRDQRIDASRAGAETADLASALNSMLDQQQAIEDRLRQFVADASHELRTPTSVISGLSQLWRQGDLRDGQALQDAMRRIGQESARIKTLVEELLLLARLDEGMPIPRQPLDLTALVDDVLADAASTNPSRHITAHLAPHVQVAGDQVALHRVVSNLITNALIHTPAHSALTVTLSSIQPTVCRLEIRDGGPGMTPNEAAHAFDRFWRAETSRIRTGSGLGLPIAQAIVTAHGGTIDLRTTPQDGTTVRIELPPAPLPPAPKPDVTTDTTHRTRPRPGDRQTVTAPGERARSGPSAKGLP